MKTYRIVKVTFLLTMISIFLRAGNGKNNLYVCKTYDTDRISAWIKCKDPVCRTFLRNCTFVIESKNVTLKRGSSRERIVPGSASQNITRYAGDHATVDMNNDKIDDAVIILTQETGGNGTFYYIAAAISDNKGFKGTNAIFLGDRITVENIEIKGDNIIIHYLDREMDESMQSIPSVRLSKTLQFISGNIIENGNMRQLTGKEWTWSRTVMNNDETIVPKQADAFTIIFKEDGSFTGKTDCNNFFGQYEMAENKLQPGPIGSTRMYCESSQEDAFLNYLQEVESYFISEDGFLILQLKYDSGSMILR